jgi:hypothetical protein
MRDAPLGPNPLRVARTIAQNEDGGSRFNPPLVAALSCSWKL